MGLIAAITLGVVSFFIGLSASGPGAGLLFGIVMFAMSYGAFVWRPSEQKKPDVGHSHAEVGTVKAAAVVERSHMPQESSARKQEVINSFAIPLTQIGLDDTSALAAAEKIVAEVLAELEPRGIDPFKSTQGDEYVNRQDRLLGRDS